MSLRAEVRASSERWIALQRLLRQLTVLAQIAATMDARRDLSEATAFDRQLARLEDDIRSEVNRLQVEELKVSLDRRMRDDAKAGDRPTLSGRWNRDTPIRRQRFTHDQLMELYERHHRNQTHAAAELGISQPTLHYHLVRHGILVGGSGQ